MHELATCGVHGFIEYGDGQDGATADQAVVGNQRSSPGVRMKPRIPLVAALFLLAPMAHAEIPIQAGLWEKTEKVTLDGKALPFRSQKICLKAGEASLERLMLVTADEATARGCNISVSAPGPGLVRMSMSCPVSDSEPAIGAAMELKVTPTSFEGSGTVEIKAKDGREGKGMSLLSGKRLGDC